VKVASTEGISRICLSEGKTWWFDLEVEVELSLFAILCHPVVFSSGIIARAFRYCSQNYSMCRAVSDSKNEL
jgi:hypothetical protein